MKVNLISKTQGVGLYDSLSEDEIVTAIARHGTIKEDSGKLIRYLMNKLHWSPLQHISYGFKIETRRSISAQIFRHRSLNGQEWSLRYAEPIGFEDIELRKEHPVNRQSSTEAFDPMIGFYPNDSEIGLREEKASLAIKETLNKIDSLYNSLIDAGVAKECARDILPLCTKTTIHITGTLRDLLGFLNVRHTDEAQKEVREIAYEIGKLIEQEIPKVMETIDWRKGYFM